MSTYLDDEVDVQVADLESIIQRFIELFEENDGVPILIAEEDEVIELINDASTMLECNYDEVN